MHNYNTEEGRSVNLLRKITHTKIVIVKKRITEPEKNDLA